MDLNNEKGKTTFAIIINMRDYDSRAGTIGKTKLAQIAGH